MRVVVFFMFSTCFHIVFVSSECLAGFDCFKLSSFVASGANLPWVVVV